MLHLVQSLDGHTARCRHQVDGCLWMQTGSLQQLYSTFHGLHYYLLGIVGFEAQLYATL